MGGRSGKPKGCPIDGTAPLPSEDYGSQTVQQVLDLFNGKIVDTKKAATAHLGAGSAHLVDWLRAVNPKGKH